MLKKLLLLHLLSTYLFAIEVILHSECDDKPYSYCEKGEVKGINIEIYKAIFSKITDYSLTIKGIEWNKGLERMKNSEIKMLGSLAYSPKERPYITQYTQAFLEKNQALFCHQKADKLPRKWPEDFYGLTIATIKGFIKDEAFKKSVKEGLIEEVESNKTHAFSALLNNRVNCYIGDEISTKGHIAELLHLAKDNNQSLLKLQNIKNVLSLESSKRHIGFSDAPFTLKENLIEKINIAIKIMKNSHEIEKITNEQIKSYLNPEAIQTVNASIYHWGDFVSDRMPSYGIIAEIVEKAFANQNIQVNYNFVHSNNAYLLTKWGESCVTLPWVETEEKQNYFYFSKPIKPSSTYLFYKKNIFKKGIKYNNFSDLKAYRIGGVKGFFYEKDFQDNDFNYISYKSLKDAMKALLLNQIDLIPSNKDVFLSDLLRYFPNEREVLSFHHKSFQNVNTQVLFSKRCDNSRFLRNSLNKGLENIKKDGTFKSILDKYTIKLEDFYDFMGNEVDSDNDGIFNEYDECPYTPENTKVDNTGCKTIDPYIIDIKYNKNQLHITGYMPSKKEHKDFISKIKILYPNSNIIDSLQVEKGKIKNWKNFIATITAPLNKLETASLKVVDKKVTLSGTLKNSEGKELTVDVVDTLETTQEEEASKWAAFVTNITAPLNKLETASLNVVDKKVTLSGIIKKTKEKNIFIKDVNKINNKFQKQGYTIKLDILALDRDFIICKNKFNNFHKHKKITFDSGTAILKAENEPLLMDLYQIAQSCPDAKINIIGHTDSLGQDEANRELSLARAKAVVTKLSELGIDLNRVHADGKGETSPIAKNSTKEGREKNRRIEFKILGY